MSKNYIALFAIQEMGSRGRTDKPTRYPTCPITFRLTAHTHCRREATQPGRGHATRERPRNAGEATPLTLSYALPLARTVASSGGQYRDPRKDPEKRAPIRPHAKRALTQQFCWVRARFLRATPTGLETLPRRYSPPSSFALADANSSSERMPSEWRPANSRSRSASVGADTGWLAAND